MKLKNTYLLFYRLKRVFDHVDGRTKALNFESPFHNNSCKRISTCLIRHFARYDYSERLMCRSCTSVSFRSRWTESIVMGLVVAPNSSSRTNFILVGISNVWLILKHSSNEAGGGLRLAPWSVQACGWTFDTELLCNSVTCACGNTSSSPSGMIWLQ